MPRIACNDKTSGQPGYSTPRWPVALRSAILAVCLLAGCGPTTPTGAFFEAYYDIGYQHEPTDQDHWQTPLETLWRRTGDCEDKAFLVHWRLRNAGIPAVIVIGRVGDYIEYHAWVLAVVDGEILLIDPTAGVLAWKDSLPAGRYREVELETFRRHLVRFAWLTGRWDYR